LAYAVCTTPTRSDRRRSVAAAARQIADARRDQRRDFVPVQQTRLVRPTTVAVKVHQAVGVAVHGDALRARRELVKAAVRRKSPFLLYVVRAHVFVQRPGSRRARVVSQRDAKRRPRRARRVYEACELRRADTVRAIHEDAIFVHLFV
jgi:chloramphenicol 3-O-phosphotransferase